MTDSVIDLTDSQPPAKGNARTDARGDGSEQADKENVNTVNVNTDNLHQGACRSCCRR